MSEKISDRSLFSLPYQVAPIAEVPAETQEALAEAIYEAFRGIDYKYVNISANSAATKAEQKTIRTIIRQRNTSLYVPEADGTGNGIKIHLNERSTALRTRTNGFRKPWMQYDWDPPQFNLNYSYTSLELPDATFNPSVRFLLDTSYINNDSKLYIGGDPLVYGILGLSGERDPAEVMTEIIQNLRKTG